MKKGNQFWIVHPESATTQCVRATDITEVYRLAGLDGLQVDHGVVHPGVGIVVYEYSMFAPPNEQRWFAVGSQLFGGKAVLYGFDHEGSTVDLPEPPPILFFRDAEQVEDMIQRGNVQRPQCAVNGAVYWSWPHTQKQ